MPQSAIRLTNEMYEHSRNSRIPILDLARKEYRAQLVERFGESFDKDKDFNLVNVLLNDAGFDRYTSLYDVFNYSYSTSSNNNNILFPVYIDAVLQNIRDGNSANVLYPMLLAGETSIPSAGYEGITVDWGDENIKNAMNWQGIAEGSDYPTVSIKTGETALRLHKYGIAIRQTFESARRSRIDVAGIHMTRLVQRFGAQNFNAIMQTLINGDGNNNAIPADMKFKSKTAGALTTTDLIESAIGFNDASEGMNPDVLVCTKGAYVKLAEMFVSAESKNGYLPTAMFTFPQGIMNGASVVYSKYVPKSGGKETIYMLNKSMGVRKLNEEGSSISGQENNQTNDTIFYKVSEVSAFEKLDPYSVAELIIQ